MAKYKFVSWNVNGIRAVDKKEALKWVDEANIDLLGNVINSEDSDGTSDVFVNNSNPGEFKEHVFTANNLEPFLGFVIKIIMTGTDSANVPKIRNLKGIALS